MLLEDATSKEEVARALEDDDQELREDINEKLDTSMRWWDAYGIHKHVDQDEEEVDFRDIATHEKFVDEIISQSPGEYDLGNVPREGNVVPCCMLCNFKKGKQSYQDFLHWIRTVAAHTADR
jgi:hypothetical protein